MASVLVHVFPMYLSTELSLLKGHTVPANSWQDKAACRYAEGYNTQAAKAIRPRQPFLVTTCEKPTLEGDCFKVEVKPIGFHAWCYGEMASA